ncbi:MAG: glycoside hydrolase family 16 protein [Verrucomicrobiota bacterium]
MTNKWQLKWSDEFNYSGIPDPEKWKAEEGLIRNQELQFYTRGRPENARVEDGRLIIEAHRENWPVAGFTSASLSTQGLRDWCYGRFEMSAKLPAARGTWPAFWTLGADIDSVDWPRCGEIDIMEYVGHEPGIKGIYGNVHYGDPIHHAFIEPRDFRDSAKPDLQALDSIPWKGLHRVPDAATSFHVYAVEWFPDRIDFFVDDARYLTYTKADSNDGTWPFDKPHFLMVNLAVGGAWGGHLGVDETAFPQRYEIEYVRVYQEMA